MSEANDTSDALESNPLANWSEAIHRATFQLFGELIEREQQLTPEQREAVSLVDWLALVFDGTRTLQPLEAEIIERLRAAQFRSGTDAPRVLAEELVKEHGARHRQAAEQWHPPLVAPFRLIAQQLAVQLWAAVNNGFEPLTSQVAKVSELLAQYEPDSGRRTSEGKYGGRLSAAGILAELNTLSGSPLGAGMNAHAVANSRKRESKKTPASRG